MFAHLVLQVRSSERKAAGYKAFSGFSLASSFLHIAQFLLFALPISSDLSGELNTSASKGKKERCECYPDTLPPGLLEVARCAGPCYGNGHSGGLQKRNRGTKFTQAPKHGAGGNCKVPENNLQLRQLQVFDSLQVEGLPDGKTELSGIALGQHLAR